MKRRAIWILWPSFVVGGIASAVFFTLFEPTGLRIFEAHATAGRMAAYTLGFFAFWALGAASSAFTYFLQRSPVDLNRLCPLESHERPLGCPKRPDL